MRAMVETSINNILVGISWIEPFEKAGLGSTMITEMLKVGMQTDLSAMMNKLLEYMDIDIKNTIDKIMAVLPQLVYSIVGISTIGSISLGTAFVIGKNLVPNPATGIMAFLTFFMIYPFHELLHRQFQKW